MSDADDKVYSFRVPKWLYKNIEAEAQHDLRSVNNMMIVLLREALAKRELLQEPEVEVGKEKPGLIPA